MSTESTLSGTAITPETVEEIKSSVAKMKMPELVAFYNTYEKPIKKFESHEKAVFNVKALLDRLSIQPDYKHEHHKNAPPATETTEPKKGGRKAASEEEKAAKAAEKAAAKAELKAQQEKEKAAKKARKEEEKAAKAAAKASPSFRYEPNPNKAPHAVRAGSMVSKMIDLIARPQGATIEELETVSYETSHSVKSLLNYDMRNQVGYGYYSSEDGKTVFILYPTGMTAPLPHYVKPEPAPKEPKAPKPPKAAKEPKTPAPAEGGQATA